VSGAAGIDWQFVVVTLAAVFGGWVLLRPLWQLRGTKKPTGACGRCSSPGCTQPPAPGPDTPPGLVRIGSGAPRKGASQ
jgi:hypothetical protein